MIYKPKDRNSPGSIWKIVSPNGIVFYLSTVDEDHIFKSKLRVNTRGNLKLQKSIAAYGIETHIFEKMASDVPRRELTTRKRELVFALGKTSEKRKQTLYSCTPEDLKSSIEEFLEIKIPLYDEYDNSVWVQKDGKWIKKFQKKTKRVKDWEEPHDKMGILDRMEMFDNFLQMGDSNEEVEDEDELFPIPEDLDD